MNNLEQNLTPPSAVLQQRSFLGQTSENFLREMETLSQTYQVDKYLSTFYKNLTLQAAHCSSSHHINSFLQKGITAFYDLSNIRFVSTLARSAFTGQIGMGLAHFLIPGSSAPKIAARLLLSVLTCKLSEDFVSSVEQGRLVLGDYGFESLLGEGIENLGRMADALPYLFDDASHLKLTLEALKEEALKRLTSQGIVLSHSEQRAFLSDWDTRIENAFRNDS